MMSHTQLKIRLSHTEDAQLKRCIEVDIAERTDQLIPAFHSVAVHFADLHDSPVRMLAKGCIRGIVEWRDSRCHFYWRLRRRLLQDKLVQRIQTACLGGVEWTEATALLRQWLLGDVQPDEKWLDDQWMVGVLSGQGDAESVVGKRVRDLQAETVMQQVKDALQVSWIGQLHLIRMQFYSKCFLVKAHSNVALDVVQHSLGSLSRVQLTEVATSIERLMRL